MGFLTLLWKSLRLSLLVSLMDLQKLLFPRQFGKDKSTVSKEIKLSRPLLLNCNLILECNNDRKCIFGNNCSPNCPEHILYHYSKCDRSPGTCIDCLNWFRCRFNKFQYSPEDQRILHVLQFILPNSWINS